MNQTNDTKITIGEIIVAAAILLPVFLFIIAAISCGGHFTNSSY